MQFAQSYAPYGDVLNSVGIGDGANYGFAGEWTDASGLVYLRARYYNSGIGIFTARDTWEGNNNRPQSFNHWAYVEGNPINRIDPNGKYWWGAGFELLNNSTLNAQSQNIHIRIQSIMMQGRRSQIHAEYPGLYVPVPNVDLLDSITGEVWEIKPWDDVTQATVDLLTRVVALNLAKGGELLQGMTPVAMPYNWNYDPGIWIPGLQFPSEIYVGTDGTGFFDIYAGQIAPGIILWWKYKRENPRFVPVPIVLPDNVAWSDRNKRIGWSPPLFPVPVYSENSSSSSIAPDTAAIIVVGGVTIALGGACMYLLLEVAEVAACGPCVFALP